MLNKRFASDLLHIYTLFGLAVAQPLYVLLSRHPGFFVARAAGPWDILLLVSFLSLIMPTIAALVMIISEHFRKGSSKYIRLPIVAVLIIIMALVLLKQLTSFGDAILITGAFLAGIGVTIAYGRSERLRSFISLLSPAILILPCMFLFSRPIKAMVVRPRKTAVEAFHKVEADAPVVFVVFDALPTISLMDEHMRIDPALYPGFASLAANATWYRNAITLSFNTLEAVPAIVTGCRPDKSRMATADEWPQSLFALLGGSYRMNVVETVTSLCPESLQMRKERLQPKADRLKSLCRDISVAYVHLIAPPEMSARLPDITQTWRDFGKDTADEQSRGEVFRMFIDSIGDSEEPGLHFIDIGIPHVPWEYLPSGTRYSLAGIRETVGIRRQAWTDDEHLVLQGYQRHLLQLSFADSLLGELLAKLKSVGLYDKALIVVTADHGTNFRTGVVRKSVLADCPMSVLGMPLLIKIPGQMQGETVDRVARIIDIVPTVAAVLNVEIPWPVDGSSLLGVSVASDNEGIDTVVIAARDRAVLEKVAVFGSGKKADLYGIGPYGNLVGQQTDQFGPIINVPITFQLDEVLSFSRVDPASGVIPAHIMGSMLRGNAAARQLDLAVAVNDQICGVTKTFSDETDKTRFSFIAQESVFRPGKNNVEIFVIEKDNGVRLARTTIDTGLFDYIATAKREFIVPKNGIPRPIIPNALTGRIEKFDVGKSHARIEGWALDKKNSQRPESIAVYMDGRLYYTGVCYVNRADLVDMHGIPKLHNIGFKFLFPAKDFKRVDRSDVQIYALSREGMASELTGP